MLRAFALVSTALGACAFAAITSKEIDVKITGVTEVRTTVEKGPSGLALQLDLTGEWLSRGTSPKVTITKAVDDTGRELKEKPPIRRSDIFSQLTGSGSETRRIGPLHTQVGTTLEAPARTATKLREVSGVVEILKNTPDPEDQIVVAKWTTQLDKQIVSPALEKAGLTVSLKRGANYESRDFGKEPSGDPKALIVSIKGQLDALQSVHLSKVGKKTGSSFKSTKSNTKRGSPLETVCEFTFNSAAEDADLVFLIPSEKSALRTTFTLKDIALP